MNTRFRLIWMALALGVLAAPAVVSAHHGSAIYDESKAVTVKGVVTDWLWANPHCLLEFDVKDDKGNSVHWTAEVSNPPDMINRGWLGDTVRGGSRGGSAVA